VDDGSAYRTPELASLYDAVYADADDVGFWLAMAATASDGPLLELGCGTGRVLLPLARAGHEVTGLDLATHMLARCRAKLQAESPEVRERVTVVEADMASFDLGRRFAQICCSCGTFHHLSTEEGQLACLERCRHHLLPHGTLVLDLFNPDPEAASVSADEQADGSASTQVVDRTDGRRIRALAAVLDGDRDGQCNDCETTYEIMEPDGTSTRLTETFPMRFMLRDEFKGLMARSGFRVAALYGDHDLSAYSRKSPGMIVVAELLAGRDRP
jgi:SAM-dependent methyltransferase